MFFEVSKKEEKPQMSQMDADKKNRFSAILICAYLRHLWISSSSLDSIQINKLVQVEQHQTKVIERLVRFDRVLLFDRLHERQAALEALIIGRPAEREPKRKRDLCFGIRAGLAAQTLRQRRCLAIDEIAVEHVERLRRLRRGKTRRASGVGIGKVE